MSRAGIGGEPALDVTGSANILGRPYTKR
jgi:hypothetical protein